MTPADDDEGAIWTARVEGVGHGARYGCASAVRAAATPRSC